MATGDEVVQWYFAEAKKAREAGRLAGAVWLMGAASETALLMLIETYAAQITNETHRKKFLGRTTDRMILVQCEKLRQSYKRASSSPTELPPVEEFDNRLEIVLGFCRQLRDDGGRPSLLCDADLEAALAKIDLFSEGLEQVHELIRFFEANEITV